MLETREQRNVRKCAHDTHARASARTDYVHITRTNAQTRTHASAQHTSEQYTPHIYTAHTRTHTQRTRPHTQRTRIRIRTRTRTRIQTQASTHEHTGTQAQHTRTHTQALTHSRHNTTHTTHSTLHYKTPSRRRARSHFPPRTWCMRASSVLSLWMPPSRLTASARPHMHVACA